MPFGLSERWREWDSQPNPITQAIAARKKSGLPLLDLTVSNPTQSNLATPQDWTRFFDQPEARVYDPHPQGSLQARQAVVGYYAERGETVDAEDLFLTAGTSEGYSHLFKLLCDRGDTVLVPAPSYPLLETLAFLEDIHLASYALLPGEIDADGNMPWNLDRESLEASITTTTRAICIVQPNNPTGSVLSKQDMEYLSRLADQHGLALIIDEVFADYCWGHRDTACRVPMAPTPLTFTLNGLSKILGLPQLKLAWIHVAGSSPSSTRAKEHLEWICDAYLSVSTASQIACPELLQRRSGFQNPIRERIRENLATLRTLVEKNPQIEPLWPQGGWCIPVRFKGVKDDEALALTLINNHGVLTHPGYFFDFSEENILVLSLLTPPKIFAEGINKVLL